MSNQSNYTKIGGLLVLVTMLTIVISYVPHDLKMARTALSFVQLAFMAGIMALAVRSVLKDF